MDYIIHNGELYHHGVVGMKWGVRRYQNPDGSLKAAGRSRYGSLDGKGKKLKGAVKTHKQKAAQKRAEREQKNAEKEKARIEAKKQAIVKRRNPEEIYKNAGLFTDQEIKSLQQRLEAEYKIKGYIPQKQNKAKKFVQDASVMTKNVADAAANTKRAYETVSAFMKIFGKSKVGETKTSNSKEASTTNTKDNSADTSSNKQKATKYKIFGEGTSKNSNPYSKKQEGPTYEAEWSWVDNKQAASAEANYVDRIINNLTSGKTVNKVTGLLTDGRVDTGARFVAGLLPGVKDDD